MLDDQPAGPVFWIDHYVVCTNDVDRWAHFNRQLLGACGDREAIVNGTKIGLFQLMGPCRNGGFIARETLPPTMGLENGLPRYGFYVEARALDDHLRRLQEFGVIHAAPVRTSGYGEPGYAVRWQDPDGNQFEFWAPDVLPPGAMDGQSTAGIGRIAHVMLESRDLARTAAFFERYCALKPDRSPAIPSGRLVLPLAAGGKLIYQHVTAFQGRTTGCGIQDTHTALTVREEDYIRNYRRMWATLPEIDHDVLFSVINQDPGDLQACTIMHPSRAGRQFKKLAGRGDDFFDCDTNLFHLFGGRPDDASFATYEGKSMQDYLDDWETNGIDVAGLARPT